MCVFAFTCVAVSDESSVGLESSSSGNITFCNRTNLPDVLTLHGTYSGCGLGKKMK